MDKLRKALSGNDSRDDDSSTEIIGNIDSNLTLSWTSRIKAFAFCFILGILVSLLGTIALFVHKIALFAVFYTLGNVISLSSTCFLMGPFKQMKKMFAPTRMIATIIALVMICLTIIAGLVMRNPPLSLLFVILQSLAMTWYSLSYIPYARDAVKKAASSCMDI